MRSMDKEKKRDVSVYNFVCFLACVININLSADIYKTIKFIIHFTPPMRLQIKIPVIERIRKNNWRNLKEITRRHGKFAW